MKKIAILVLLLFCGAPLHAQKTITYHLKDSTTIPITIDSIFSILFTGNTQQDRQYQFRINPDSLWGQYPYEFPVGPNDSVTLTRDSSGHAILNDYYQNDVGYSWMHYDASAIDSINVLPRFPEPLDTNSNVVEVSSIGKFRCPLWTANKIYAAYPLYSFDIDSAYQVVQDTEIEGQIAMLYIAINKASNRLLETSGLQYASSGLDEILLDSANKLVPINAGSDVSSALYYGSGTDSIIFYSYHTIDTNPGYYLLDRNTGKETLILKYLSDFGPWEMVNGFDISPDGKKLLVPVARSQKAPIVFEYDMTTRISDTLNIAFDSTLFGDRECLWLRYNHDGSEILYDNYPSHSFQSGEDAGNYSEIGIIDRATLTKRVLRTNPTDIYQGISLMPEWSPDETKIIYSCGSLLDDGTIAGNYRVCILTTIQ